MKNLRLFFFAQVNAFCITAAFKIKNTVSSPSMLIITNQFSLRVRTESGFACSAKSKENSCITFLPNVSRAMHAQHIFLLRQNKIQYPKNAFLDFSSVTCSCNQNHFVLERNNNRVMLSGSAFRCVQF